MEKNATVTFKDSYKNQSRSSAALSVYNTGRQQCPPNYQWGPGIRDHYLMHYVISGRGYYTVNDSTFSLSSGDLFLAFPGVPITYKAHGRHPWEYCWVGFNGSDALPALLAAGFSKDHLIINNLSCGPKFQSVLTQIYECRGGDFSHTLEMTGKLYSALALLVKNAPVKGHPESTYVQKAVEYIHGHYAYGISVEEIADYTGISRSQLYRVFLQETGQSPKEYLTNFRMNLACRLLKTTFLPVGTIAASTGFENSLYFSKAFHKIYGQSPSMYRRSPKKE